VGLHIPKLGRRVVSAISFSALLLFISACSAEDKASVKRLAEPTPITKEGWDMHYMWLYSWLALMVVGVIVWGLIFIVPFVYRRKKGDTHTPVQVRYHLPIEVFYTLVPVMMVIVMFFFTVRVQNDVVELKKDPDYVINVVGFQWSWAFNYEKSPTNDNLNVYEGGTTATKPELWIVKDKTVEFQLTSPDVIHSFWVPAFIFKLDVVPGRVNKFQVTPDRLGTFDGRCAELCGVYHSRMLFNLKVVTQEEFDAHMKELEQRGNIGKVAGGTIPSEVAGLESKGEAK